MRFPTKTEEFSSPRGAEVVATYRNHRFGSNLVRALSSPRGAEGVATMKIEYLFSRNDCTFSSPRGAEGVATMDERFRTKLFVALQFSSPRGAEGVATVPTACSYAALSVTQSSRPLAGLRV